MPTSISEAAGDAVEGNIFEVPSQETTDEKSSLDKKTAKDVDITTAPVPEFEDGHEKDNGSEDAIIVTGADAALHLLPMRDDGDAALTFRSLVLATGLSAFQAVMSQIYIVRGSALLPMQPSVTDNALSSNRPPSPSWEPSLFSLLTSQGRHGKNIIPSFWACLVEGTVRGKPPPPTGRKPIPQICPLGPSRPLSPLLAPLSTSADILDRANVLPRGDHQEARWREKGGQGKPPRWIRVLNFVNPGPWSLKEHAVCAITATGASNAAASVQVFAAQDLFYNLPLSGTTVVLSTISIGLFGYGLCGIMRPVAVWHVESVYWSTLPTVKTLQGLHWQDLKNSKPLRYFWYAFGSMFAYEWFPAYIFPWLNSVSIPCLASMNATGSKAAVLTNLFGGATNNEGLGLFSLSFDWQYITTLQTSLPLKFQYHAALGYLTCFVAMLGIYYGNGWDAKSLPFMSTSLRMANGSAYPTAEVFSGGQLNETAMFEYGIPRLTGSFAFSMFMANAAIGALIAHCILFCKSHSDIRRFWDTVI